LGAAGSADLPSGSGIMNIRCGCGNVLTCCASWVQIWSELRNFKKCLIQMFMKQARAAATLCISPPMPNGGTQ
jgi:hypothetical protein